MKAKWWPWVTEKTRVRVISRRSVAAERRKIPVYTTAGQSSSRLAMISRIISEVPAAMVHSL